jgi:hypothetical protein
METRQQMARYHQPAQQRAAAKALSPKPSGPAHAGPSPQSPLEMSPGQLHSYNTKQVGENTQAELLPYRQRNAELSNIEQTAAKRYAGYGEATQAGLAGLQSTQQASAKTATNEAAESALRASKAIETAGQTSAQQNAGYVDPQLKAALGNQQANVTATGQAREAGAQAMNQNESNYLTNVRAAAAQRIAEGQQGITSTYGKQRGEVGGQERQLLAKMPGQVSKLDAEGLQHQFNNAATEQGLGIKIKTLGQKAQETQARVGATIRGQNIGAETQRRGQNVSRENSERTAQTSRQNKAADLTYKETHPTGTKSTIPKAPNPAEGRKYMKALSEGVQIAKGVLGQVNQGRGTHTSQTAAREALAKKGATADQISAALNLAVYGRLGPQDRKTAEAYGLTPAMRAQWFRNK